MTKAEAAIQATHLYEDVKRNLNSAAKPLLNDCIDNMVAHCKLTGLKKIKNYRSHAKMMKEYVNSTDTIEDIVSVGNKAYVKMLAATKPNGQPYSANTIIKRLAVLRRTASLAYSEWGLLENDIAGKIARPKPRKGRDRFLTMDECRLLIDSCEYEPVADVLEFSYLTGIRNAEFERLDARCINDNRIIIDGKNGDIRSFAISKRAVTLFHKVTSIPKPHYDTKLKYFTLACEKANIKGLVPHDLRHTFASLLIQSGKVSIYQLQKVMGHKTIGQTTRYAHLMPKDLDDVATQLDFT